MQLAYEQLLEKLRQEGLFNPACKRPIPKYPEKIGLITSDTGAALHDMLNILTRRYPPAKLILYPALVQGREAPASLIRALNYLNEHNSCDVILLGRGGGSLEDLWAFNDEGLVRAVAASRIPVISAVGHETDVTLCDFAADLRAPTPSAAAELAVPDAAALLQRIEQRKQELEHLIQYRLFAAKQYYDSVLQRESLQRSSSYVDSQRQRLNDLENSIRQGCLHSVQKKQEQLAARTEQLSLLNPWQQLQRGWSVTQTEDGSTVHSVRQLNSGDRIRSTVADGEIYSRVERIVHRPTEEGAK